MSSPPITLNTPEERACYFIPKHVNSPGTPVVLNAQTPTLFTPLKIRGVTLRNRIVVAPMCQFSTSHEGPSIGKLTPYHVATLGHYALKGAALTFIEATGVQPNGRISPNCPGLWDDAQIEGVRTVAEFIQAQGGLCGLQLAHAGRKASTVAPWVAAKQKKHTVRAGADVGGWPENVVGPMGGESQTWDGKGLSAEGGFWAPRQLSESDIRDLVKAWADAALRGIAAGVDVIEIHAAHGYLIHEFLSPITNQRTDRYGGSFENRIRLLLEIVAAVRQVMPPAMPLFLRLSSTEWMEKTETGKRMGSWDVESTIRLAKMLPELGVDLLDVSSGGNHPEQMINVWETKDYQTLIAARIRKAIKAIGASLFIGAVGLITEPEQARDIVEDSEAVGAEAQVAKHMTETYGGRPPMADVILVGRQFMREPEWVLKVASKLGIDVAWPIQFLRVRFRPELPKL